MLTVYVYLKDHKAQTLTRVVDYVESFAAANNSSNATFMLAAGSAGIASPPSAVAGGVVVGL